MSPSLDIVFIPERCKHSISTSRRLELSAREFLSCREVRNLAAFPDPGMRLKRQCDTEIEEVRDKSNKKNITVAILAQVCDTRTHEMQLASFSIRPFT